MPIVLIDSEQLSNSKSTRSENKGTINRSINQLDKLVFLALPIRPNRSPGRRRREPLKLSGTLERQPPLIPKSSNNLMILSLNISLNSSTTYDDRVLVVSGVDALDGDDVEVLGHHRSEKEFMLVFG